jgi:hypothetical protein
MRGLQDAPQQQHESKKHETSSSHGPTKRTRSRTAPRSPPSPQREPSSEYAASLGLTLSAALGCQVDAPGLPSAAIILAAQLSSMGASWAASPPPTSLPP